ncbi:MAG: 2-oxo acid dehydrogenase subunit E2 [Holosporales bacterium]|jgi:pyruvate dehydrogenase E2 component (dihydrolipoamide acetyltransferase)|nr:2-oxo acid dehydrogenase subunit E2 [Holosporales bacterium]
MPVFVTMPSLSPTMKKGTLIKWFKKEGDKIELGEVIAEIDTDKAAMDVESKHEGTMYRILVQEGTHDVHVRSKIAVIKQKEDSDEDVERFILNEGVDGVIARVRPAEISSAPARPEPRRLENQSHPVRVYASPLAKRIAIEYGIDIEKIGIGSGPNGRIVKNDVLAQKHTLTQSPAEGMGTGPGSSEDDAFGQNPIPTQSPAEGMGTGPSDVLAQKSGDFHDEKVAGVRLAVANTLIECKQTVPHFYMQTTANVSELHKLLLHFKKSTVLENVKITANEFVIKAVAIAMRSYPNINAMWVEDTKSIRYFHNNDVAFTISTGQGELYTPVIRNADKKSIIAIATEVRSLVEKARRGSLKISELQGAGITTSNLGVIEVESFLSIINPPQASIVSIPRIMKRPIVNENDEIVVGYTLTLGYAIDHRVIDGKEAGLFLAKLKEILGNPIEILI